MIADRIKQRIIEILRGIDKEDDQDPEGFWETSVGAEFGRKKLNELLSMIDEELKNDRSR